MTESDAASFVHRFEATWAARSGPQFLALWHPEGQLHTPFYDRVIHGREIGGLNDYQATKMPELRWHLLGWTWRGPVVVIEWRATHLIGGKTLDWRGVDKLTLRDGRIIEEIVYADTALLHGLRLGAPLAPLLSLPVANA
jgi:hypothetical protein